MESKRGHNITDKERLRRCVMHVPVGVFGAWLMDKDKHSGWAFLASFWGYEVIEQIAIDDDAYVDIIGSNVGWAAYKIGKAVWKWRSKKAI